MDSHRTSHSALDGNPAERRRRLARCYSLLIELAKIHQERAPQTSEIDDERNPEIDVDEDAARDSNVE